MVRPLAALAALTAVLAATGAALSASGMEVVVFWSTRRANAGSNPRPTSQALLASDAVVFNMQDASGAFACWTNTTSKTQGCVPSAAGSTYSRAPVPAAGASLHGISSAFAFSSHSGQSAGQASTVAYFGAQPDTGGVLARGYTVAGEAFVSLAPLTAGVVALRYRRRAIGPGRLVDHIAIRSIHAADFPVVYENTTEMPESAGANVPYFAEQVVSMEGTLLYVEQDGTGAAVIGRSPSGAQLFRLNNPCGVVASLGHVGVAKVGYQTLATGETLEALLVLGRNASGTVVCHVSHHSGRVEHPPALSPAAVVQDVTGGYGYIAVTGTDAAGATSYVTVIDASTGAAPWTHTRQASDSASGPAIAAGEVFFQSGGHLTSRSLLTGAAEQRANLSCSRTPALTSSRVYCVTDDNKLFAFSPKTNMVMWTQSLLWQFAPQVVPNTEGVVATVTQEGGVLAVDAVPIIPEPTRTPAPGPGPRDAPRGGNGAVTALIVILVLASVGGIAVAVWWRFFRGGGRGPRRSAVTLVNDTSVAHGDAQPAPTPKASGAEGLYGAV